MRGGVEVRVGEEGKLQFIGPELDQVEFSRHLIPRYDMIQHFPQTPGETRQPIAVDVQRRWQPFPVGNPANLLFVFAQVHRPPRIALPAVFLKPDVPKQAGISFIQGYRFRSTIQIY